MEAPSYSPRTPPPSASPPEADPDPVLGQPAVDPDGAAPSDHPSPSSDDASTTTTTNNNIHKAKRQKTLSSLTSPPPPEPAVPDSKPKPAGNSKKKKKNNNVWTKPTSRKGKKKSRPQQQQQQHPHQNHPQQQPPSHGTVLITPIPRFPDRSDDSPDAPICLSRAYKAERVELSDDRLTAGSTKGYRMVRATRGVVDGAWYFEIKVLFLGETGHTRLGWTTDKGDLQAPVGYDANSFGYRDIDGSKVHRALRERYGDGGYSEGDVIGFYINLPDGHKYAPKPPNFVWYKGQRYMYPADGKDEPPNVIPGSEIAFFKNGICQGVAYTDLCGGRYYPAASMYTLPNQPNCEVRFNFGPDFESFPQDFGNLTIPRPMIEVPYHGYDGRGEVAGSNGFPDNLGLCGESLPEEAPANAHGLPEERTVVTNGQSVEATPAANDQLNVRTATENGQHEERIVTANGQQRGITMAANSQPEEVVRTTNGVAEAAVDIASSLSNKIDVEENVLLDSENMAAKVVAEATT